MLLCNFPWLKSLSISRFLIGVNVLFYKIYYIYFSLAFQDSVLTATTDHHKTIIISCVSLSVVMLLCILLLWFKRRKIPCFRQCVSLQQQPGVVVRAQRTRANDINAWTLNFLPSYEEAEATKPTCSPPTFEETLECKLHTLKTHVHVDGEVCTNVLCEKF